MQAWRLPRNGSRPRTGLIQGMTSHTDTNIEEWQCAPAVPPFKLHAMGPACETIQRHCCGCRLEDHRPCRTTGRHCTTSRSSHQPACVSGRARPVQRVGPLQVRRAVLASVADWACGGSPGLPAYSCIRQTGRAQAPRYTPCADYPAGQAGTGTEERGQPVGTPRQGCVSGTEKNNSTETGPTIGRLLRIRWWLYLHRESRTDDACDPVKGALRGRKKDTGHSTIHPVIPSASQCNRRVHPGKKARQAGRCYRQIAARPAPCCVGVGLRGLESLLHLCHPPLSPQGKLFRQKYGECDGLREATDYLAVFGLYMYPPTGPSPIVTTAGPPAQAMHRRVAGLRPDCC